MKRLLFIFAIFPAMLLGQNPGHQIDRVQNQFGQGVPNPSVRVCTEPAVGSPCTNLATIYTCNAINGSCIGPNPLTGDQYGNYNFFAPNNVPYHLEFTGPSLIVPTILYYVYLAGIGGGGGGAVPCGVLYDVQINNPLGDFGCDPGIFQENPATHTVTDTIVQATQQIQVSDPTQTGVINFGSSNGTSIVSNFLLGLSPTFSTTSGGYGVDVPDSPAIGALTVTSLTPGTDGRLPTAWAPSSGAISCENVPTLQGCNANYPATTSDIQYTLYPASDDYVFKAPPNSSYGSSAVVQDCLMMNLGSPPQNSCACTHTYSGTTVTISCKLPHVFPGDSIVAFGAIICGLGCGEYPQFTDSQSNIYTQLDPETTGASGGASVDGITVGVAGNYSDTVTATFLSINSEYYSSLHVIELRGVTGITAHGGTSNTSGPVTSFPGVTTTGGQAILGFSFDNTYGAQGCGYSAGTGYQMINQDAITNGSFGDEAIIETNNGTYTPTINRNSGCLVGGGTAQTVALAYTGMTTGSDILWPQRLRFSTLVVGGDFDPLQTGTGLFSPDGQRVSALTFGSGLTLSGSTLTAAGGTVTGVSGTANQIDVATGTTTPVISLDSAIIFPGTITMGAHAADFSSATSFKPPGGGGTLTVGTANQNWATLGTGIVKNTTTTGALSDAAYTDVVTLWASGSCSGYLKSDGTCSTSAGSIAFSGITTGTNTSATMTVGTGATLTISGSGVNNANKITGGSTQAAVNYSLAEKAIDSAWNNLSSAAAQYFSSAYSGTIPANWSGTTAGTTALSCKTNPSATITWTAKDETAAVVLGTWAITSLGVASFTTTGSTTATVTAGNVISVTPSGMDGSAIGCVFTGYFTVTGP